MHRSSDIRAALSVALPALVLSVVAAVGVAWASGWTLGVFIGGFLLTVILVPSAVLASDVSRERLLALVLTVMPQGVLWTIAARRTEMTVTEWGACLGVLLTFALALAGIAGGLRAWRVSATVSAALTVVAGLAWLTWPVWLSRTWSGEESAAWVDRLVTVHPALVLRLPHLGQWVEQSLAYHLTDLNQNVPYSPPQSVWTCAFVHGLVGVVLLGFAHWRASRPQPAGA